MPTIIQKSFSGGEIAPALYARTDITKYATGLRTLRNFVVQRHGGARNRPGTQFVAEVKDSSAEVRLIPFIFNDDQTYVLEFGNEYIRFHTEGAPIRLSANNITGATAADPVVVTSASHGYSNGDYVYISGVLGMTELNNRTFIVANQSTNTFELQDVDGVDVDGTGYGAYTSGGTAEEIYEIASPYATADLIDIQFAQSADVMTLVHPSYAVRELARTSDTSWAITSLAGGSQVEQPLLTGSVGDTLVSSGSAGSTTQRYKITMIHKTTGEESETTDITVSSVLVPSSSDPVELKWRAIGGQAGGSGTFQIKNTDFEFNVYKYDEDANKFGLLEVVDNIGLETSNVLIVVADTVIYNDVGGSIDTSISIPSEREDIFDASNSYPSAVGYIQQRRSFGNTNSEPEDVWMSRVGSYNNFTVLRSPIQDNDTVNFNLAGRRVNAIRHMLDLAKPVIFTAAGEWVLDGNEAGAVTPAEVYPKQHSYHGSAKLRPLIIDSSALFLQARQSIIRDLGFSISVDGYQGNDITIFSSHLFDSKTVVDWDYSEVPNSVVWAARNDGVLLGLTYIREQQMLAWHRHDFNSGTAERACSVPENNEDGIYFVVKRTINGSTRRYIERFREREFEDIKDAVFVDASFTFDGRNSSATTMTLSGGSTWEYDETLTLTASTSFFSATEVGNSIHLNTSDGDQIRAEITAFTSGTVVSVKPNKLVPTSLRNVAVTDWARAVDEVAGLWDLEGLEVSILADGYVKSSPNNSAYPTITVSGGKVSLDSSYSVIHVGIPFVSDFETLDIDINSDGTLIDINKKVVAVNMDVQESRGIWVGPRVPTSTTDLLDGLTELKIRDSEGYDDPVRLVTDKVQVHIKPEWNSNGRIFIRQVDPLPLSILSAAPSGSLSEGGV